MRETSKIKRKGAEAHGYKIMKIWKNGRVTVEEVEHDYDLHAFDVYAGSRFLGTVYPSTIEDMEGMIKALDGGEDPVSDGWEDGCGHYCTLDGWGMEDADDYARRIRKSSVWQEDYCAALCELAGMSGEWEQAGAEDFEEVLEAAAEKLGVSIY